MITRFRCGAAARRALVAVTPRWSVGGRRSEPGRKGFGFRFSDGPSSRSGRTCAGCRSSYGPEGSILVPVEWEGGKSLVDLVQHVQKATKRASHDMAEVAVDRQLEVTK